MSMENATVTIPYPDFHKLQQRATEQEQRADALVIELAQAKAATLVGDPRMSELLIRGLLAARTIALFATGQLPPEATKGWPAADVKLLGETLHAIRDLTVEPDLRYHADDLLNFVKAIEDAEAIRRAQRMATLMPLP